MVDVEKQVAYWTRSSAEDWDVGQALVERGNVRHGLFFAHLALEKALKAQVCARTQDLAPRTHNLVRLAEAAGIQLSTEQTDVLAEMNSFALEGRYPDALAEPPTAEEAQRYLSEAHEVLRWLTSR